MLDTDSATRGHICNAKEHTLGLLNAGMFILMDRNNVCNTIFCNTTITFPETNLQQKPFAFLPRATKLETSN
jgi:hypothetical protein